MLFALTNGVMRGEDRRQAEAIIVKNHYSHSFPSGKSHIFFIDGAIVVFSIPANKNIGRFILGRAGNVWELTRLWAPDGHAGNLLTVAISGSVGMFRRIEPKVEALVSFADPNAGHAGGIYRAASWIYTGQSEESRNYRDKVGNIVARRAFHSGSICMTKAQILAAGYSQLKLPGKFRFVRGLTRSARRDITKLWCGRDLAKL